MGPGEGVPPRPTESPRTRVRRFSATVPHPWRFRAVFGHWNAPRRHCADNARANWAATPWGTPYDPRARARPRRGPRPCATPEKSFSGLFCAFASSVAVIPGRPWTFSTTPAPTARGRTRATCLDDLTHDDRGRADHTEGAHRAARADGQGRPRAGERMAGTPSAETQGPIAGNCVPNHVPKTGVYGDFLTGQKSVFKKFGTFFGTRPPKPPLQTKTGHRVYTR